MEYTKEDLQRDAGIPHLPTDLTYELRMAVSGHKKDEFLSWGFQWTDKPHRLVFTACREIERQADEIERLRDALRWAAPYVKDDPRVSAIIKAALKEGE